MDIPYDDNPAMRDMWDSMIALYTRFNLLPPTRLAVGRKLKEEAGEFIVAMKHGTPEELADEAADVIFVLLGGLYACGLKRTDIIGGLYRVMAKNGAKTPTTHRTQNGTIERIRDGDK